MRVHRLPVVAELADGRPLAVGDEDRVVAEAAGAARLGRDAPFDDAAPAEDLAAGCDRDELRDVPCAPVLDAVELGEELLDRGRALGRVARGADARPPVERGDLDARVLPDRPPVGARVAEPRLAEGVLVIGRTGLVG
jgi:hypothetical protein